jgi:hypothetical protein
VGPAPGTLLRRVREACTSLPEVTERPSHGTPTFFVRQRPAFVMAWVEGHHEDRFPHLWYAAPPGAQEWQTQSRPDVYFRPPYVGQRGWIGVRLDRGLDWTEVVDLCEDAYRTVAPRKLVALLDS